MSWFSLLLDNNLFGDLKSALKHNFVHCLIHGFTFGVHSGIEVIPESSYSCHNPQPTHADPDTLDTVLAKEVKNSFVIGPFTSPPFPIYRISPIGIATRHTLARKDN